MWEGAVVLHKEMNYVLFLQQQLQLTMESNAINLLNWNQLYVTVQNYLKTSESEF